MGIAVFDPKNFTPLERDIIWLVMCGERPGGLVRGLSVPRDDVKNALAALRVKTGTDDLRGYAFQEAEAGRLRY